MMSPGMALLLTTIFSAALWVVLIALGTKPFDALMLSVLIVLVAGTAKAFAPFLPGNRRKEQPGDSYTPR
jgi:hypothetical protein